MKNGRYYLDYLRHRLKANTRHGTHSPFVYRLLEEVIYAPRRANEPRDNIERLMVRLRDRFASRHEHRLLAGPAVYTVDFVTVEGISDPETEQAQLLQLWPRLHTGSVVVIRNIYHDAASKRLWRMIQSKPEVTVTIDLFHVGLVFFHKGQAKEDFMIRY